MMKKVKAWQEKIKLSTYLLGPPYLTAIIQILNEVRALILVYTFRFGKVIIVSPLINAGAPKARSS